MPQRFVGVWVAEALEAGCEQLCLAGSPQTHMDVDLKDGTNASGIWDCPMSIRCYLWSCVPWSTWKALLPRLGD